MKRTIVTIMLFLVLSTIGYPMEQGETISNLDLEQQVKTDQDTIEERKLEPSESIPTRPDLVIQMDHHKYVRSLAFSPDGKTLASGSFDNTIKLREISSARLLRTLSGHHDWVDSISFSMDGKILASAGWDKIGPSGSKGSVKLWGVASGNLLNTMEHSGSVYSVRFNPDGKTLACGSGETIKLWDFSNGKLLNTLKGHSREVIIVSFSPDGKILASGSEDETIKLWDVESGRILNTLKGQKYPVTFSPNGNIIASSGRDSTIRIWDVPTGLQLRKFETNSWRINSLSFHPDGRTLASGGCDKEATWRYCFPSDVKLWDVANGQLQKILKGHEEEITTILFSSDGKMLASAGKDNTTRIWDIPSGKSIKIFQEKDSWLQSVSVSPNWETMALTGCFDYNFAIDYCNHYGLILGKISNGKLIKTFDGHSGGFFSKNGKTFASIDKDGIKIWDSMSGEAIRTLEDSGRVNLISFSPDGNNLAALGRGEGSLKLWDILSGKFIKTLDGPGVHYFAFSPDGKFLASEKWDIISLWEIPSGRLLKTLEGNYDSVSFSPDGKTLVSSGCVKWQGTGGFCYEGAVKLWEMPSGRLLKTLQGHSDNVTSISFRPDGKILVSGSADSTAKVWEVPSGRLIKTLQGHSMGINFVCFSPDGKTLATASKDNTIKIWQIPSGQLLQTLEGHSYGVNSVFFSPDGKFLASWSNDSTLRFWDPARGRLLCTMLVMGLKDWIFYTPGGFFDVSEDAKRFISWTVEGLNYPAEKYWDDFYMPDILTKILAGEEIK